MNLKPNPIEGVNDDTMIKYINSCDMKEIFIPLNLEIDTRKNTGVYEIDFKIHVLTLQGIKFGVLSSYSEIYANTIGDCSPFDIVGGYIGIFNNKNNSIVCWDGYTQHIININKWYQTNYDGILQQKDIITMIIDTKYKLMHLKLKKSNDSDDICCISFKDCIKNNEFHHIRPCVSLLFYQDCIEISQIRHYILDQHLPQKCPVNKKVNQLTYIQAIIKRYYDYYIHVKMSEKIILFSILIMIFCVCVKFCLFK